MASMKHTELKGEAAQPLTHIAQQGATLAEYRPLSTGKGDYATFTVGGQVGPINLGDGKVGYGRVTMNVNLTRIGTPEEFAAARAARAVAASPETFALALDAAGISTEQRELILATLARKS